MRTYILSTCVAAGLGAFAIAPVSAAPIATHGLIAAPTATTDVACRTVKKTVVSRGVKRVTTTKECDGGRGGYGRPAYGYGRPVYRQRVYEPRRYYAPRRYNSAPGLSIQVR